ncbi:MAG: ABC transporter ATP-binding protein [Thermoleophilaceae bacterium]|nr:ABC transporter ATP-binding protein [Thermoleophilaceae bacterium]
MLAIEDLSVDVLGKPVLRGVSAELAAGSFTASFGHNGAGKTTLLRTIMGLWRPRRGRVLLDGEDISGWPTQRIVRAGVSMVPQLRGTFDSLTVEENLGFAHRPDAKIGYDDVYRLFPVLRERRKQVVQTMSGGQRQMVAVANALMSGPRLLLLDEPSGGLAPRVVDDLLGALKSINREFGITILLVEQNVRKAASLADGVIVLNQGTVAYAGDPTAALEGDVWQLL